MNRSDLKTEMENCVSEISKAIYWIVNWVVSKLSHLMVLFLAHLAIGQEKPKYGARDERVSTLRRRAAAPLRRYSY